LFQDELTFALTLIYFFRKHFVCYETVRGEIERKVHPGEGSSIYRPDSSFGGTASYQWLTFERACVSVNGSPTGPTGPDANCGLNPNGNTGAITISADGRFVAFEAQATDLVTPNTDSGRFNIFVRDLKNQTTTLVSHDVSVATTDGNGNSDDAHISADGNWISFNSAASNLIASGCSPKRCRSHERSYRARNTHPPAIPQGGPAAEESQRLTAS